MPPVIDVWNLKFDSWQQNGRAALFGIPRCFVFILCCRALQTSQYCVHIDRWSRWVHAEHGKYWECLYAMFSSAWEFMGDKVWIFIANTSGQLSHDTLKKYTMSLVICYVVLSSCDAIYVIQVCPVTCEIKNICDDRCWNCRVVADAVAPARWQVSNWTFWYLANCHNKQFTGNFIIDIIIRCPSKSEMLILIQFSFNSQSIFTWSDDSCSVALGEHYRTGLGAVENCMRIDHGPGW